MLFREFCEYVESFTTPTLTRKLIAEMYSKDCPGVITNFLLGKPIGNDKIGVSTKTVSKVLGKHGIKMSDFSNPGEAAKEFSGKSVGFNLEEVQEIYEFLYVTDDKIIHLERFFTELDGLERKTFVNILLNKHQNRIGWGVIKYALAEHYNDNLDVVDTLYKKYQSIDKVLGYLEGDYYPDGIGIPLASQLCSNADLDKIIYPIFVQPKIDGFRAQVHIGTNIKIYSGRNIDNDQTESFPDLVEHLEGWLSGIYDGEIVIMKDGKIQPFNALQHRLNVIVPTEELLEKYPAYFIPFDLLHDGTDYMLEKNFYQRHYELRNRCKTLDTFVAYHKADVIEFYGKFIDQGYEGIVLKTVDGLYFPGEGKTGHRELFKYKPARLTYDCLIINAKFGTGKNKDLLSSFEVALKDDDCVHRSIGWVGSGFTEEDLQTLTKLILVDGKIPLYIDFLLKRIIIEVKADCVLKDACRFLRFVKLRTDKTVSDSLSDLLGNEKSLM